MIGSSDQKGSFGVPEADALRIHLQCVPGPGSHDPTHVRTVLAPRAPRAYKLVVACGCVGGDRSR